MTRGQTRQLVTGASGFIGRHLVAALDHPVALGRDRNRLRAAFPGLAAGAIHCWGPGGGLDVAVLAGVDVVYHLAGESLFHGRWTARKKARLVASRLETTRALVDAMAKARPRPRVLVAASAVGVYGDRGDEELDEESGVGSDFLAELCFRWEREARRAEELGVRVVSLRLGVVLGPDGGALPRMARVFRWGLGGRLGSGRQFLSWIDIEDLVRLMRFLAAHDEIHGPVNAVAPYPVRNREFTAALGRAVRRPAVLPAPAWLLRMVLGEFAGVLLSSQRVVPQRALAAGFEFRYPAVAEALAHLLGPASG